MPKVKVDDQLYAKITEIADIAGYSTPEEFIAHILERELKQFEGADDDADVLDRLKGLGYIS